MHGEPYSTHSLFTIILIAFETTKVNLLYGSRVDLTSIFIVIVVESEPDIIKVIQVRQTSPIMREFIFLLQVE